MKVINLLALVFILIGSGSFQLAHNAKVRGEAQKPVIREMVAPLTAANIGGTIDPSFGTNGKVATQIGPGNDVPQAVALQPDGKIVVAGYGFSGVNNDFALVRYNADGTLDQTFDGPSAGNGKVLTPIGGSEDEAFGVALQPDGKIVAVGQTFSGSKTDIAIARFNTDGTLDTAFDGDGRQIISPSVGDSLARSVAIQPDGRIVIAGTGNNGANIDIVLLRLLADGSLDTSFDGDSGIGNGIVVTQPGQGNDQAYAVTVRPDGKIVVAGYYSGAASIDTVLLRYLSSGSLDPAFGTGGIAAHAFSPSDTDEALSMALQPDGKIVIAGCIRTPGIANDFLVARLLENGSRDDSFAATGLLVVPFSNATDIAFGVALQNDGKIIAVGFGSNGSNNDFAVSRVNTDGTLDVTFGMSGKVLTMVGSSVDNGVAIAVQPDGKAVVVGRTVAATADFGVVRYLSGTATVSGRILTATGAPLRSADVFLRDPDGVRRRAISSSLGFYQFNNVPAGIQYTISVSSRRYRFQQRALTVEDNLSGVDLVGLE